MNILQSAAILNLTLVCIVCSLGVSPLGTTRETDSTEVPKVMMAFSLVACSVFLEPTSDSGAWPLPDNLSLVRRGQKTHGASLDAGGKQDHPVAKDAQVHQTEK